MKRFNSRDLSPQGKRHFQIGTFVLITFVAMLYGCSHTEKVWVPPRFDLKAFDRIGVIGFSSNIDDRLGQYTTQDFIQTAQSAQPGIRFLELGNREQVLKSISRSDLDFDAVRLIGKKFGVDALLTGDLDISEVKPKLRLSSTLTSIRAEAYVEASLSTKLLEADSGATLWTRSSNGKRSVAKLRLADGGHVNIGVSDPRDKYGQLVSELVDANTSDFWPHYEYIKVKK